MFKNTFILVFLAGGDYIGIVNYSISAIRTIVQKRDGLTSYLISGLIGSLSVGLNRGKTGGLTGGEIDRQHGNQVM